MKIVPRFSILASALSLALIGACSFEALPIEDADSGSGDTSTGDGSEPSSEAGADAVADGISEAGSDRFGSKICFDQEVGENSPAFGCSSASCDPCTANRVAALCAGPVCAPLMCPAGWGSCDNDVTNGCETKLSESAKHCGACDKACSADQVCDEGVCKSSCSVSKTKCGRDCADTASSDAHCGGCDKTCSPLLGGGALCSGSMCITYCQTGLRACPAKRRCEPATTASCGNDCARCPASPANGTAFCNIRPNDIRTSACDSKCNTGFQKCSTGCCTGTRVLKRLGAGSYTTFALSDRGAMFSWGTAGSGEAATLDIRPQLVPTATIGTADYVRVKGGSRHACGLTMGGTVRCWGSNYPGSVGVGPINDATAIPVPVQLPLTGVTSMDAFGDWSCAVSAGSLYCWGKRSSSTTYIGPTLIPEVTAVRDVYVGDEFACTLDAAGTARCFGDDSQGNLGHDQGNAYAPVLTSSKFLSLALGRKRACGITTAKTVECWGRMLGALHTAPFVVAGLANVEQMAAGSDHHCAVTTNGEVKCWGSEDKGKLGNGIASFLEPSAVFTVPVGASIDVTAGSSFSCALTKVGDVFCWGDNINGVLGNGSTTPSLIPVRTAAIPL
ncbi:MAG: hypothetical protein KBF88_06055 [Polyangiaceae bacterium]|nr:hypothetical protein [Polyangiaceae bacterium]